jgi:receptor protein-tyrosine kinase
MDLVHETGGSHPFAQVIQERMNEAAIAAAVPQPTMRIVSRALPSPFPYRPNLPVNLAIGLLGGTLLAIGWVMLQEQTNSAVRAPGEAGTFLTVPELGAIPRVKSPGPLSVRNGGAGQSAPGQDGAGLEWQGSSLAESFRATLASILSTAQNGNSPRSFVITSSGPMEGKTTVVSNLGIALTEISGKVLLIDGDMRRPRLHKVFEQANSWGLSDVLREKNAIENLPLDVLVRKTAIPHLYLLPSGPCTDNIFGLLYSGRLSRLLPRFQEEFEYVLIDAPPCLEFADARIMARYTEQLLLVMRANSTDRRTAQRAVRRLLLDGIPVMGVILNSWVPDNKDAYYMLQDDRRRLS